MVKILQECTGASIVLAGDSNQAINGFMGSVDPIGNRDTYFPGAKMLPLSQTWRYHNQIADVFNAITAERCIGRPERPSSATTGDTIVLCGTNKEVDAAVKQLRDLKIKAYKRGTTGEGVQVSTVHKAKGGGWHTVVVMRMRRNSVKVAATAVSRARERLFLHYSLMKEYSLRTTSHVRRFGELRELVPVLR
jgi:superfamily I DNA/RNA helicase